MRKLIHEVSFRNFRVLSRSKSLVDGFGHDLLLSISKSGRVPSSKNVVFCLGPHLGFPNGVVHDGEVSVCVQTEHFFDDSGRPFPRLSTRNLWLRMLLFSRIAKSANQFDYFWDLSFANRRYYPSIFTRIWNQKFLEGPYLFPPPPNTSYTGNKNLKKVLFVGSVVGRRQKILANLSKENFPNIDVQTNLFGVELYEKSQNSSAILNIHAYSGTYTEWPRVLHSVLACTDLISDELSKLLEHGEDYILLDELLTESRQYPTLERFTCGKPEGYFFWRLSTKMGNKFPIKTALNFFTT